MNDLDGSLEEVARELPAAAPAAGARGLPGPESAQAGPASAPAAPGSAGRAASERTVRVDVELLDTLMRQVGELVLARNQLISHPGEPADGGRALQRLGLIGCHSHPAGNPARWDGDGPFPPRPGDAPDLARPAQVVTGPHIYLWAHGSRWAGTSPILSRRGPADGAGAQAGWEPQYYPGVKRFAAADRQRCRVGGPASGRLQLGRGDGQHLGPPAVLAALWHAQ